VSSWQTVSYVTAQDLFKQLRAARADGSHDRRMLRFTTPDLLVIDVLGLRALRDDEPVDLYEIIRTRYERHSTLITSNRTAQGMGELFGDPLLASAAMDPLLHDAHVLILEGASFRNPPGERRKSKKSTHQEASS
jgi:DNA replication protein DnaC